jgi:FecR protein
MRLSRFTTFASVVLAAILSAPAWAARTALPGTLNYVEGSASIGAQALDSKSIGSAELQAGQSLATEDGKAEILLTPGVYLRVGDNSSVRLISPSLIDTRVAVEKGEAMVEVDELHSENDIRITENGINTQLVKTGLYDFDANQNQLRVFDGKAVVQDGDRNVTVKGGHELALATGAVTKPAKFDKDESKQADLYRWSSLRSSYLAEANVGAARTYVVNGWYGPGWVGAGWYWNPWFASYSFIPGDGFLYSPFGWGFYSPFWAYRAPIIVGGGYYHRFGPGYRPVYANAGHFAAQAPATSFRGAAPAAGFRGPSMTRPAPAMSAPRASGGFGGAFHGGFGRR